VNRGYVKSGSEAVVFLAMDISPPSVTQVPTLLRSLNVCLAIDRSGSMNEEKKLEMAKLAANQLIQALKPSDYASIVSFADSVCVEVPARLATDVSFFNYAINAMKAKGLTDIHSALNASFQEMMRQRGSFSEQPVNRIILLTDGQPTKGKDKVDEFTPLCTDMRRNDISVTALGVGSDYNEQLLSGIASTTGGVWYHVTDPRNLPNIFAEELIEMKTVVMVKPELYIQPMSSAELSEIHKVRPMLTLVQNAEAADGKYRILLADVVQGQPQNVVAKVHLPARPDGQYRIAKAELRSGRATVSKDIVVTYTSDPNLYGKETDPYPRVLLMTSEGTILLRNGIEDGDATKISQAQTIVKTTFQDPNAQTILRKNELVRELAGRFDDTAATVISTKGKLSEEEKKKALSETTVIKKKK
jgi:Ca-activated chloride channel family protein